MASAVLASGNESGWTKMGKIPYNPRANANPNPNPNLSLKKKKQKQFHHQANGGAAAVSRYADESPAVTQTASDDAYSFNQSAAARNGFNQGGYMTYNVGSYGKSELIELRKRLTSELDQIRELRAQIESGQIGTASNANSQRSQPKLKKLAGNKRPGPVFGSVNKESKKPCNGFGNAFAPVAVDYQGLLKECRQVLTKLMKHKHGWIFNKPVDAVALKLHDYHQIVKRPMDLGTVKTNLAKNLYHTPAEFAADVRLTFNNALLYNPKTDSVHGMADVLLARFEELFRPIQEKIDSTSSNVVRRGVESSSNVVRREREIREFDDDDNGELRFRSNEELQGSSWDNHTNNQFVGSPVRSKKTKPRASPVPFPQVPKKSDVQMQVQSHSSASTPSVLPPVPQLNQPVREVVNTPSPVRAPLPQPQPVKEQPKSVKSGPVKLPKPRAKDPNKRDMTAEEKHKLGMGLQSLPQEKMPQLIQIIRKRNEQLGQDDDEIELDIEALDVETLWELDRFVTNWKKMVSKTKRQALIMNSNPAAAAAAAPSTPIGEANMGAMSEKNDESGMRAKRNEDEEEDVDIDDDMPTTSFPPVEIEKDEIGGNVRGDHEQGNASSSSSSSSGSSSDSSSSSDSDSGSSSGSDSDADDAQS